MLVLGVLACATLVLQYGFPLPALSLQILDWIGVVLGLCYVADLLAVGWTLRSPYPAYRQRRLGWAVLLATGVLLVGLWLLSLGPGLAELMALLEVDSVSTLYFETVQLYLFANLCLQLLQFQQKFFTLGIRPELVLAESFAVLILIGTLLLLLPKAAAENTAPVSFTDALFTATSAACVTGLTVRDTGTEFSTFGQFVICAVVQIGGLGIITFVALTSIFGSKTLPVPQLVALQRIVNVPKLSGLKRQILAILIATAFIELAGAACLFAALPADTPLLDRMRWALFHSVSAFCNAGFAFQSDSMIQFQSNWAINLSITGLVILGGMGFLVIPELVAYRMTAWPGVRRLKFARRLNAALPARHLSVQTRLSLAVMGVLLVGGTVGFWIVEWAGVLAEKSIADGFLISFFQAVTARTAGFNTIEVGDLALHTLVFMAVLMAIGANPVSTAGGIKTVTLAVLLLALRAMIMRRDRVEVFGKTLPARTLVTALSVCVLYVAAAIAGIFFLTVFDGSLPLRDLTFEAVSALSTVGLSTGITADLSTPSRLVLCVLMFLGRVGPISLVLSVFQARKQVEYEYPEAEVVVG